jgi:hypothetical protein
MRAAAACVLALVLGACSQQELERLQRLRMRWRPISADVLVPLDAATHVCAEEAYTRAVKQTEGPWIPDKAAPHDVASFTFEICMLQLGWRPANVPGGS